MESALYGIYALVFVSEILLVRCAHSFDFWYVNNSCVNTVRQHFPWSILYILLQKTGLTRFLQMSHMAENALLWEEIREWEPKCKLKQIVSLE